MLFIAGILQELQCSANGPHRAPIAKTMDSITAVWLVRSNNNNNKEEAGAVSGWLIISAKSNVPGLPAAPRAY